MSANISGISSFFSQLCRNVLGTECDDDVETVLK